MLFPFPCFLSVGGETAIGSASISLVKITGWGQKKAELNSVSSQKSKLYSLCWQVVSSIKQSTQDSEKLMVVFGCGRENVLDTFALKDRKTTGE